MVRRVEARASARSTTGPNKTPYLPPLPPYLPPPQPQSLVDASVSRNDLSVLKQVVDALLEESAPVAVSRATFKHLSASLAALPPSRNEGIEEVCTYAAGKLAPRIASFEEADYSLRYLLYQIHWGDDDFYRAALVLSQARLDSPSLPLSDEERTRAYVRVAQGFLRCDDDTAADRFIRRAQEFVHRPGVSWGVQVQHKTCYAQILDARRKFLDAALRYFELANLPKEAIADEGELVAMVERAAKCSVLAPAGPQRQRVMGSIYRDERAALIDVSLCGCAEREREGPCRGRAGRGGWVYAALWC